MYKKPTKTAVAIAIFTLAEAFALKLAIIAPFHLVKTTVFPNDFTFNLFALGIAAIPGYLIGNLIFQKWDTKFWVKIAAACCIVLISVIASYWLVTVVDRHIFEQNFLK